MPSKKKMTWNIPISPLYFLNIFFPVFSLFLPPKRCVPPPAHPTTFPLPGGGGAFNFQFGIGVQPKGPNTGLWTDHCQIWDPCELKFLTKCSHVNEIIAQFEAKLFANSEALEVKISRNLWFWGESRVSRPEKCLNGGLANGLKGSKRRSSGYPIFQWVAPPDPLPWLRAWCKTWYY